MGGRAEWSPRGEPYIFDFDPNKSAANKDKHGIDFVEAQKLWGDPRKIRLPSTYPDEARSVTIGTVRGKVWAAVWTMRENRTRIISVRRAREAEVRIYESQEDQS